MSPEDGLHSSPLGFSSIGEDVPLSCGDHLESFHELGRGSKARSSLYTKNPEADINWWGPLNAFERDGLTIPQRNTLSSCFSSSHGGVADGKNPFLKTLIDAEAAANSAAIQLVSFKDAMEDTFAVCYFSFWIC